MTLRVLVSFHYFRDVDMAHLVDRLAAAYHGPIEVFADSGAYSAATLGTTVRLADYQAWLTDWAALITTAATLDVIGDPVTTTRNTHHLHDAGHAVLPVFHTGTPWPALEALCARHPYVALGGMVPHRRRYSEVMRWLVRCFRIADEHGTVFHGFGQTNITALSALPFYSVDSSTWALGARYGSLRLWDDRLHRITQLYTGDPAAARRHARLLRSHGADPVAVSTRGFALKADGKPEATYRAEDEIMRGAPALAFHRLGAWLQQRHAVPAPIGHTTPGTRLYLADTSVGNFLPAARVIAAHTRKGTSS
ncbi:hypothetical protein PH213_20405 [Streptomyces sp. SRF1]|uniref:hypothetical protein n=1 Tax=Streptomyces sp. SRF1 TaxID=1549642 RepID=UPI0025B02FF4|nr:hypothetical protein [Streptomyces sp. SRF1]MDN3056869.1 hypothetical protein [Streptomyces sp. SRF1]